jgi:hypothetical protein
MGASGEPAIQAQAARRAALLDELEQQILELRSSARWAAYLRAQSRFHRYSPRNVLLIATQRPEATQVAGYHAWRRLGRRVNPGERAISILAPITIKEPEGEHARLAGFRWVSVFDLEQTSGVPLPSPVSILEGDATGALEGRLVAAASMLGFTVRYEQLPRGVNGECRWSTRTLAIEPGNPPAQRVKTLVHEMAHGVLHEGERQRPRAEIEAESAAFVVLGACGMDTSAYSAGYVASWIGDEADVAAAIRSSCDTIQRAAGILLTAIESSSGWPPLALPTGELPKPAS